MQRRLAAILVADVVGYSRLMEADEAGTIALLRVQRDDVLTPVIAAHAGRIVKLMGDGVLAEFPSAIGAAAAALDLQERMAAANAHLPEDRRLVLRIGVNLGELIDEGDDIYGEAVNVAARLEALAEPGGVCVSAKVQEEAVGKLDCAFEDIGEQTVKNIVRPVRAYRLRPPGEATSAEAMCATADLSLPDRPSIAVLPFQNMSADPEQDYFADGIVEDIITELSRSKWLFVIARNSSFRYKGRAVDVKAVGRELGVRYVLEGSVRKAGQRVRITGQLIDAQSDAHLWADRYDGDLADIFDLQDRVTASVVGAIGPRLEAAEINRAKRKATESLDAYDHYLRGLAGFHAYEPEGNAAALKHFARAIELDDGFASAYGMAARCYVQQIGFGWLADREAVRVNALGLSRKAVELGSDDAVALAGAGFALVFFGAPRDGAAYLEQALTLNPNLAWAWHTSGFAKAVLGETDAAIKEASRAIRLSPQDPQLFAMQAVVALGHLLAGRPEDAFAVAETALRARANFALSLSVGAASAALSGRTDLAGELCARLTEVNPRLRLGSLPEYIDFQHADHAKLWKDGLRLAGLPE